MIHLPRIPRAVEFPTEVRKFNRSKTETETMDSVTFGNITKSITGSVETIGKPGGLSVTDNVDDIQKIVTEIDSAIVSLSNSLYR